MKAAANYWGISQFLRNTKSPVGIVLLQGVTPTRVLMSPALVESVYGKKQ